MQAIYLFIFCQFEAAETTSLYWISGDTILNYAQIVSVKSEIILNISCCGTILYGAPVSSHSILFHYI